MDNIIPTEYDECVAFTEWLRLNNIPHHHSANESQSGSKNAMIRGAKLKRIGQSRGYWDYDVYVPMYNDKKVVHYILVKVEMKRIKGGKVSEEQKEWQKIYTASGIPCKICYGASEAIDFIKECENKYHIM